MNNDFEKKSRIFKILLIILCLFFNIFIFLNTEDSLIMYITIGFSLIVIIGFFIYDRVFENYITEILMKLSDMISTISDLREKEVFTMIDDSMFSKLQHQTIKLTKVLQSQNTRIEKDKNEIKTLISDISHQLKTPLANMKMYSEFLQDESLTKEEREEFNKIILLSLDKLCFLVESMIKMSRLESSVISIKPKLGDLNDTVILAISQLYKKAGLKNIHINFEEKDKVNIYHDKKWTCEAIFNIIENAIKYSPSNTVINIVIEKYEIFTKIDIKDEGRGISEEEIPKIFSRFYRGKNVSEEEGIGIGLYLSREIIKKENGYIKVLSTEEGSTFSVFLPNDYIIEKSDEN